MYTAIISRCIRIPKSISAIQSATLRFSSSAWKHVFPAGPVNEGNDQFGSNITPVKMVYSLYESTKVSSSEWPVIIMHGLFGSKDEWNSLSKVLRSKIKRKIFAVDARNHGESPHTPEMSYHHLVEDLRGFMKDLDIKQATMLGHSMGGRAMMLLALKYPELVEKLIVLDISPIGTRPNLTHMLKYIDGMKTLKLGNAATLSVALKMADEQMAVLLPDPGTRQFFLSNLIEAEPGRYRWRVNLDAIAQNLDLIRHFPLTSNSFNKPTFFIGGGESDYLRHEEQSEIRRYFPAAKFEYIPGTGHWMYSEKPSEFIKLVTEFVLE